MAFDIRLPREIQVTAICLAFAGERRLQIFLGP
jgi:hypothetical protein